MVHPFTRIRELIWILPTVLPFLRRSEQNPPEPTTRTKGLKRLRRLIRFKSLKRNETASVHFANEQEHIGILISETTVVASGGPSDGQELQDNRVMLAGPIDESGQYDTERIATTITSATSTPMLVGEPLSGDDSPPNYEPQPRDGETCLIAPVFHFALLEPPYILASRRATSRPGIDSSVERFRFQLLMMAFSICPTILLCLLIQLSLGLKVHETPDSQSIPTVVQDPLTGFAASEDGAPRFSVIKGIDKLPNELLVEILARLARSYWLEDAKLVCGLWFPSPFYTIQTEEPDVRDQILGNARRIINSENFDEVSFVIDA
ncbi:unnamed protein product [Cyclocybe aegerita]|uniref:F-box domain-containing protein n=1 Tax=Cyclocybe aegerita TaxID=1973307 RepID=A0A8S0WU34_CYCAE|nr:unnamed protein product [Cyclocybe aegerita]